MTELPERLMVRDISMHLGPILILRLRSRCQGRRPRRSRRYHSFRDSAQERQQGRRNPDPRTWRRRRLARRARTSTRICRPISLAQQDQEQQGEIPIRLHSFSEW